MHKNRQTRYALVTGGGSGLGRAFSLHLASQGWYVAVTDLKLSAAKETLNLLTRQGGQGHAEKLDVTDSLAWQDLRDKLQTQWPQLHLLINNAGICSAGKVGVAPFEDSLKVLDTNLRGVLCGCHTMVPWLKETAPGGHVLNIASLFGIISAPTMTAYCASKAAVVAFSESLHGELAPHQIGVTVAVPGFFPTNLIQHGHFDEAPYREIASEYMARTNLTAEEVVHQTLKAIEKKQLYVALGKKTRWYWRFKRFFPTSVTRLAAYRYRRQMLKHSTND